MTDLRSIRVKENGGSFTSDQFRLLKRVFDNRCVKCGAVDKLHADHIIPVAMGGHSDIDNIQPLCPKCNLIKHAKESIDYRKTFYKRFPLNAGREFIFKIRFLFLIFYEAENLKFINELISDWNFDPDQTIFLQKELIEMEVL